MPSSWVYLFSKFDLYAGQLWGAERFGEKPLKPACNVGIHGSSLSYFDSHTHNVCYCSTLVSE